MDPGLGGYGGAHRKDHMSMVSPHTSDLGRHRAELSPALLGVP